jgi:hypothetical protein
MSPRTTKYVEAMIREGDNFDYDQCVLLRALRTLLIDQVEVTDSRSFLGIQFEQYSRSSELVGSGTGLSQRVGSKRFLLLLFVIAAGPRRKVGDARYSHKADLVAESQCALSKIKRQRTLSF